MSRIFRHVETGMIYAMTSNGQKVYTSSGTWHDAPKNVPLSGFVELPVTEYPVLYASLERQRTWTCCGGIRMFANEKCSVCGESY